MIARKCLTLSLSSLEPPAVAREVIVALELRHRIAKNVDELKMSYKIHVRAYLWLRITVRCKVQPRVMLQESNISPFVLLSEIVSVR